MKKINELAGIMGVFSTADARACGVGKVALRHLCENGIIERVSRGLYELADADVTAHHALAQIAKAVPHGIICLISALDYYEIGTQLPHDVWVAIPRRARPPSNPPVSVHVLGYGDDSFNVGFNTVEIEGVCVRIYCPAKTLADCYKYRSQIGLDVCLEAMREIIRKQLASVQEIRKYAQICRVTQVMLPHLEAM